MESAPKKSRVDRYRNGERRGPLEGGRAVVCFRFRFCFFFSFVFRRIVKFGGTLGSQRVPRTAASEGQGSYPNVRELDESIKGKQREYFSLVFENLSLKTTPYRLDELKFKII